MSYLLFPVQKVLLEYVVKLGKCIFFSGSISVTEIERSQLIDEEKGQIRNILERNNEFFESCGMQAYLLLSSSYSIKQLEKDANIVEQVFDEANRALDYVRILECPFAKPEYLLGIPGLIGDRKYVLTINNEWKIGLYLGGESYYYSMQPGIGLDLGSNKWSDIELYKALFSNRKDTVYSIYRNIIADACEALRIRDLNRCFVYLFSKVDGMGQCSSYSFRENKIRILSCISENQNKFDVYSHQYYFYSKVLRTEIVHKGASILNYVSVEKANKINQNLFSLIVEFCKNVINTGIDNFYELEHYFEQKVKCFVYNRPEQENPASLQMLTYKSTTYVACMEGLNISIPMKRGNIIMLPKWEDYDCRNYYPNYVRKDLGATYDEVFDDFSIDDFEYIIHITSYRAIQTMIRAYPVLIGLKLPRLMDDYSSSVILRDMIVDYICDELDKCTCYDVLSNHKFVNGDVLPPKSGIKNGIRSIYEFVEDAEDLELRYIPGRVYEEYRIPEEGYDCWLDEKDDIYNILYRDNENYINSMCKKALEYICESYYCIDYTMRISYLFDLIDRLHPLTTNRDKLVKLIFTMVSCSKTEYLEAKKTFEQIREKYRNPLLHGGKNILEIESNVIEIKKIEDYLRQIIIDYCREVHFVGISTWEELDVAFREKQRMLDLIK